MSNWLSAMCEVRCCSHHIHHMHKSIRASAPVWCLLQSFQACKTQVSHSLADIQPRLAVSILCTLRCQPELSAKARLSNKQKQEEEDSAGLEYAIRDVIVSSLFQSWCAKFVLTWDRCMCRSSSTRNPPTCVPGAARLLPSSSSATIPSQP